MKKFALFLVFALSLVVLGTSFARKPAVEPVLGISIDDQKKVAPSQAQGFDFNVGRAKTLVPTKELPQSDTSWPWPLMALLALLPLSISLIIVKKARKLNSQEIPANAIDLAAHRKKKDQNDVSWRNAS